jgi:hypothetical protein
MWLEDIDIQTPVLVFLLDSVREAGEGSQCSKYSSVSQILLHMGSIP